MANSIIDDMLKNQAPNKEKKKGSKILLFVIVLLVILLIAAIIIVVILKNQNKLTPKAAFIQYLGKNSTSALNFEKRNNLNYRLQNESAESQTEITGNMTSAFSTEENEIDLSDVKVSIDSKNNPTADKNSLDLSLLYKDNEIISFNVLSDSEKIGIFSEKILTKYVGSKYANLGNIINKISGKQSISTIDFSKIKNTQFVLPQISNEMFAKYVNVINKNIPDTAFSSKAVTLDRNSEKVNVTEYSMKLTESQAISLVDVILQTLKSDDGLLDAMLVSIGDEATRTEIREMIKVGIEQYLSSLYENTPDDSKIYTVKVYGANDLTYKISLDIKGEKTIDIDYNYSDAMNSITITFLENQTQSGYTIDIIKKVTDVTEDINFVVSIVQNSDIIGKIDITSGLVSSRKFIYFEK